MVSSRAEDGRPAAWVRMLPHNKPKSGLTLPLLSNRSIHKFVVHQIQNMRVQQNLTP